MESSLILVAGGILMGLGAIGSGVGIGILGAYFGIEIYFGNGILGGYLLTAFVV